MSLDLKTRRLAADIVILSAFPSEGLLPLTFLLGWQCLSNATDVRQVVPPDPPPSFHWPHAASACGEPCACAGGAASARAAAAVAQQLPSQAAWAQPATMLLSQSC